MKYPKACRLDYACGDDGSYSMGSARLELGEAPVMVATNGRILAVVPLDPMEDVEVDDVEGIITVEALKEARKPARRLPQHPDSARIGANGGLEVGRPGQLTLSRPEPVGEFPRWRAVLPEKGADDVTATVSLNPKLLLDLAQAIGSPERITLELHGATGPIRVDAAEGSGHGAIMPITVTS